MENSGLADGIWQVHSGAYQNRLHFCVYNVKLLFTSDCIAYCSTYLKSLHLICHALLPVCPAVYASSPLGQFLDWVWPQTAAPAAAQRSTAQQVHGILARELLTAAAAAAAAAGGGDVAMMEVDGQGEAHVPARLLLLSCIKSVHALRLHCSLWMQQVTLPIVTLHTCIHM
jgi:hypothetical protein